MSTIHVCPQAHLGAVLAASGAGHVVSFVSPGTLGPSLSPALRTLQLGVSDISEIRAGHVLAGPAEIAGYIAFLHEWDRQTPLVLHCYAGVSRSTAAALIALCALDPDTSEANHARRLRRASPSATPNTRLVALADVALQRNGRLVAAASLIGRGTDCFEGNVFALSLPDRRAGARHAEMG